MLQRFLLIFIPLLMCIGLVLLFTKSRYNKALNPTKSPQDTTLETMYLPNGDIDVEGMNWAREKISRDKFQREQLRAEAQREANKVINKRYQQ